MEMPVKVFIARDFSSREPFKTWNYERTFPSEYREVEYTLTSSILATNEDVVKMAKWIDGEPGINDTEIYALARRILETKGE